MRLIPPVFKLLVVILIFIFTAFTFAQDLTNCDCRKNFDKLIEKVEANYIGYHLTRNEISADYQKRKNDYRKIVDKTDISNCTKVLQQFLTFFKDGHLFVAEYPNFSKEDLETTKNKVRAQIQDVKNILPTAKTDIEGYWTDGESKFAVVKNIDKSVDYDYIAVILEAKDSAKIGEIKFAVTNSDGKWEGIYYTNGYASRYAKVTSYKNNTLLNIWGGILWGKLDSKEAPIYRPTTPTLKKLNDNTALLTIPSFLIDKKILDDVIKENDLLNLVEYLIIDIRGNTGGNGIYFGLLNYFYEKPMVNPQGLAISSEDNIAYFSKFTSNNANSPYNSVVSDMKAEPNKIVKGPNFGTYTTFALKNKLKKVVILIDKGNMSAAETFILHSKGVSNKVVTMGENTGGVVDYNNINIIKLDCEKYGISLGYPTYTLHDKIPNEGYNKTGIAPDIKIENSVKDKIGFILKYLADNSISE